MAQGLAQLVNGIGGRQGTVTAIPVSAIHGDHVVERSQPMAWYRGPTLLERLESLPGTQAEGRAGAWRLPVQLVLRSRRGSGTERAYAGQLAGGGLGTGAEVVLLPSRERARIREVRCGGRTVAQAEADVSVAVTLDREVDLSRGDWIVPEGAVPAAARRVRADVVWMHAQPTVQGATYLLKHTTRVVRARLEAIEGNPTLAMNEIGSTIWEMAQPCYFDRYEWLRATGAFIVIDPTHFGTVGAGMIQEGLADAD